MYRLVNVPHHTSRCKVETRIKNGSVHIVLHDPKIEKKEFADLGMCDLYIGEHMFDKPDELRKMVGDAMRYLILEARDAGYRQAQADIRGALGMNR